MEGARLGRMADVQTAVAGRVLTLTNLDKVLYPATGFTKAEVINYYLQVAPTLLPHLADRVITRLRFPNGIGPAGSPVGSAASPYGGSHRFPATTAPLPGGSFYEKNAPNGTPSWVRRQLIGTSDGVVDYVLAEDEATLVWLANLAALELHVPQWTLQVTDTVDGVLPLPESEPRLGEPLANRVVVDLDPGEGVTMADCARAALLVAGVMAADGLVPIAQTSGSKGIQVYAAVQPCRSQQSWSYVKWINQTLAKQYPDFFVTTMSVAARAGRIYVDYNQNLAARNTISPYSLRGRKLPSVATPITWDELGEVGPTGLRFSPETVLQRIEEHGDLAADLLDPDPPVCPLAPDGSSRD